MLLAWNSSLFFDLGGEENIFHMISISSPTYLNISEISEKSTRDEEILDAIPSLNNDCCNCESIVICIFTK